MGIHKTSDDIRSSVRRQDVTAVGKMTQLFCFHCTWQVIQSHPGLKIFPNMTINVNDAPVALYHHAKNRNF